MAPPDVQRGQVAALGDIVLLGCGHAHLAALRRWRARQNPVVITRAATEIYSGRVPSALRGEAPPAMMDLRRAVAAAGGTMIVDACFGIDLAGRVLRLESGRTVPFALLSLDLGAISSAPSAAIPSRPVSGLIQALETSSARRVVIAGGGPVGTELALALAIKWGSARSVVLVTPNGPLPDAPVAIRRGAAAALRRAGVTCTTGRLVEVDPTDATVWAAGLRATGLAQVAGLDCDADGFVKVDASLRSLSHPFVLAGGDCAAIDTRKSGALAVRSGAVLATNLARLAQGRQPLVWRAPRQTLTIIGVGHGRALAWRGQAWLAGRPAWWLKTMLDDRWMEGLRGPATAQPPDRHRSKAG